MADTENPFNLGDSIEDEIFTLDDMDKIDSLYLVPDGEYLVECASVIKEPSKSSGNPMLTWEFRIVHGAQAGKTFKMWTVLTPSARWKLQLTLGAMGLHDGKAPTVRFTASEAIGRQCIGTFVQQEYNGRLSSRLDAVTKVPEGYTPPTF